MITKENLLEIQQQLQQEGSLRLTGLKDNTIPSDKKLFDWLDWLINIGVVAYTTSNEDNTIQCAPNCARSFSDLYRITLQYKENVTLEDLLITLIDLVKEDKIRTIHCGHINKKVWFLNDRAWGNWGAKQTYNGDIHKDEYGFTHNEYIEYYENYKNQLNGKEEIKEEADAFSL